MTSAHDGVAGMHKPTFSPQWLLWGVIGVVGAGLAVAYGIEGNWTWVGINLLLLASSIVNLWRLRIAGQTIVSPERLRVRRGLGGEASPGTRWSPSSVSATSSDTTRASG
jgi:hypothetical protein